MEDTLRGMAEGQECIWKHAVLRHLPALDEACHMTKPQPGGVGKYTLTERRKAGSKCF